VLRLEAEEIGHHVVVLGGQTCEGTGVVAIAAHLLHGGGQMRGVRPASEHRDAVPHGDGPLYARRADIAGAPDA